jgi:hypothetical protein
MSTRIESSDSLLAAMTKAGIPADNYEFVRKLLAHLGIGIVNYRFVETPSQRYVRAVRRDRHPDLQIFYGFTTGFTPRDVARMPEVCPVRDTKLRREAWYVTHPTNRVRDGSARSADKHRAADRCACGLELPLTGKCDSCDG